MLPGNVPVGGIIGNRYEVTGWIGGGANGQVYEVIDHHQGGRVCALKLMSNIPNNPWHEAAVLTGLDGEFVLPILNADHANGVPFIVTEVMRNKSLEQRIPSGIGVGVDQACRWIQHACRGLARIHDRSLLHNDIKPENLFLDDNDEVLVGDLGLACLMDSQGKGQFAGTFSTMAPEVADIPLTVPNHLLPHQRPTSVASDVYSLGATLYWLLAGHPVYPPGHATNAVEYLTLITTTPPEPIRDAAPHVPQGLGTIVMRAIERNPADRYASPAALDAAIGARTKPTRIWTRTAPCAGHTTCFDGTRPSHVTLKVCAVPTGQRTQHVIQVHRQPSGHKVNPWSTVANETRLPQALRAKFRALS